MIYKDCDYPKIKVGDTLVCLSNKGGRCEPVEYTVTKIGYLEMFGIRHDINEEVEIMAASIVEHKEVQEECPKSI